MALVSELDFPGFVALRRKNLHGGGGSNEDSTASASSHEYAYISDRQTRATFEKMKPIELAVAASVRMYKQVYRNQLLGNAVKVSERQFPRIHSLAKQCADTLQIAQPQLYIVSSPTLNAMTFGTNDESVVIVHSALVDHYSDEELLTVIGHECGHIHNSHVVYLTALNFLTQVGGALTRLIAEPAILALRAWSRRAEITCDRAGMLCSKNSEASARALTKLVLGSRKLYDEFNMDAFLEQYEEGRDGVGKYMEAFASHPWLPKRVLAMRVFAESELYRRATKSGPGGLSIREVDDRVRALLKGDA
jgi:Zn-dependent protease with chaperone function